MKTVIAGSRTITDFHLVLRVMLDCPWLVTEVVSGGARGVDALGERWAKVDRVPCRRFPAQWMRPDGTKNMAAGIERNFAMAKYADALVAIWDGQSRGTKHMIETMRRMGKPVYVVKEEK